MRDADTGDDVYGEDPTVNRLESLAAAMTGKQAALFVSSGTQGNLLALLSQCARGDEYIAGHDAHTYRFEAGGGAVLGGIQPQPIQFNDRGELSLEDIREAIKPDDFHFAQTRLVCLENTQEGKVLSLEYMASVSEMAAGAGLRCHLDGARVFNAAVELGKNIKEISGLFDTVSICMSKGLAAPVGSVLVGDSATISAARRWRKMLGGGMRQAGILAAGGIYALSNNVDRLADDHRHARELADCLTRLDSFALASPVQTNMLLLALSDDALNRLRSWLLSHDVRMSGPRWVLHRDIGDDDLAALMQLCTEFDALERA